MPEQHSPRPNAPTSSGAIEPSLFEDAGFTPQRSEPVSARPEPGVTESFFDAEDHAAAEPVSAEVPEASEKPNLAETLMHDVVPVRPVSAKSDPAKPKAPAVSANPYTIKKEVYREPTTRPDQIQEMRMVSRRRQYLPTMYGLWWMATLVLLLMVSGLTAFHALEYEGYDPLAIRFDDLQDKVVFLILGGSMLASLFLVWVLQNTAKGLTSRKPNPESAYNNVYGIMLCLLIIGSMKLTSDVIARTTDDRTGGQLSWLRDYAWGKPADAAEAPSPTRTADPAQASTTPTGTSPESTASTPDSSSSVTSLTANATSSKPTTSKPVSTTGRNLPQAKPQPTPRTSSYPEIRVGDPTKSVMAESMRTFQSAAGRARMADQNVMATPQPDLKKLTTAAPIERVATAHLEAFEAHLELARIAATLPETAKVRMLEAGATVERTEEQVESLRSLLSLESAVTVQNAEAGVHGARAAYAGFLAQHFGAWSVKDNSVTFENAELGATAVDLQAAIGKRETELKAARYDAVAH